MKNRFRNCVSDFEISYLLEKCKEGDNESFINLINDFYPMVVSIVSRFYICGSEKQDLIQEGLIGLFKAVKDFDTNKGDSFPAFARICIRRNVLQAVRSSNSKKQLIHTESIFLFDNANEDKTWIDQLPVRSIGPLDEVLEKESLQQLYYQINSTFSELEITVLKLLLEGNSYLDISLQIQRTTKSVDNTIMRLKKKIKRIQLINP